jgi:hypothetical protein
MQEKIRERMNALETKNIAFAPILMSWTSDPRSGRNPQDWWVDGIWDFVGIDHYHYDERGQMMTSAADDPMWEKAYAFYSSKNKIPIALGEWGNRGTDAAAATEMRLIYELAQDSATSDRSQILGLAYFDSGLNSPSGAWTLEGAVLEMFHTLQARQTSLLAREFGNAS